MRRTVDRYALRESYLRVYNVVAGALEKNNSEPIPLKPEHFSALMYPLRRALSKAGLHFGKGTLDRGNKWPCCDILFFPESVIRYPIDNNHSRSTWYNTLVFKVSVQYEHADKYGRRKKWYFLRSLHIFKENMNDDELCEYVSILNGVNRKSKITFKEIFGLLHFYVQELNNIYIASDDTRTSFSKSCFVGGQYNNFTIDPDFKSIFTRDYDKEGRGVKVWWNHRRFESLLFSATLFSLCKFLFQACRIRNANPEFALQLQVDPREVYETADRLEAYSIDDPGILAARYSLEAATELWCDYRRNKTLREKEPIGWYGKWIESNHFFRNDWSKEAPFVFWWDYYFPKAYTDHKKLEDEEPEFKIYQGNHFRRISLQYLDSLVRAPFLPILFPSIKKHEVKAGPSCMTVKWGVKHNWNRRDLMFAKNDGYWIKHERIKSIYFKFMQLLNYKPQEEIKAKLQACYDLALSDLRSGAHPTVLQSQQACLLGSLYFARQTFEEANVSCMIANYNWHIAQLKKMLIQEVTIRHFAAFVQEVRNVKSPYHNILFYEDSKGIYLHYKEYWPSFLKYCQEREVVNSYSAGKFRREILAPAGVIRPQYSTAASGKYARYDYRKKDQDLVEATVLNVSPALLASI